MKSWEVLRNAIEPVGAKRVAMELRLSQAMVYKWCQEPRSDDVDSGGARNPLDRLAEIYRVTQSLDLVSWLCNLAGGYYVQNSDVEDACCDTALLANTQRLVQDFSGLLSTVTQSIEDDGRIEPHEAEQIRVAWEQLKSFAEAFTSCCERGDYM